MTTPNHNPNLVQDFNDFVDEMSGGIPGIGVKENAKWYKIIGGTGPVFVDSVEFSTIYDDGAPKGEEVGGQTPFIRTITLMAGDFRKEEVLHRNTGLAFWDPILGGGMFIEEHTDDDQVSELVRNVALHALESLVALRDGGKLQALNEAD
jgi:hypothetical protein